MLDLYKNIKKYRTEQNITQQQLALKAGYKDKSMIAKIEKGLIDLPQSKIIAFADIFGIEPGELMGWNDYLNGSDGMGNTELERFQNSLFFKSAQNRSLISDGFESMLRGIYDNIEEIDIDDTTYYKLTRGGVDYYVEFNLLDTLENRTTKYIRGLISEFSNEYITTSDNIPNAAHTRTDKPITDADIAYDEDIMDSEDF